MLWVDLLGIHHFVFKHSLGIILCLSKSLSRNDIKISGRGCVVSLQQHDLVKTQSAIPELTKLTPHGQVGGQQRRAGSLPCWPREGVSPRQPFVHFCPLWGGASPALAAPSTPSCSDFSSCVFSFICYQCVIIKSALKPLPRCFLVLDPFQNLHFSRRSGNYLSFLDPSGVYTFLFKPPREEGVEVMVFHAEPGSWSPD